MHQSKICLLHGFLDLKYWWTVGQINEIFCNFDKAYEEYLCHVARNNPRENEQKENTQLTDF